MTQILLSDFVTGLLVFIRIGAMFTFVPFFNNKNITVMGRLALALIITYLVFFQVPTVMFKEDSSVFLLALLAIKEGIVGIIMGFTLNLVFYGISFAGLLIGRDLGLAMSAMFDPVSGTDGNVISTIISLAALVVFILINGHQFIIQSLVYSYKVIPIGKFAVTGDTLELIVKYTGSIFILAVKIASPIIVAFFLVHIASGIIARVSPSFQVFFVLLPLKIGLGIFLLVLVMPLYISLFRDLIYAYEEKLLTLIQTMVN